MNCNQCNDPIVGARIGRKYCGPQCYRASARAASDARAAAGEKRCSKCHELKPIDNFSNQRPNHVYQSQRLHGWCKQCRCDNEKQRRRNHIRVAVHKAKYENDLEFRAAERLKAMAKVCRRKNVAFDLDSEWLVSKLKGACELTGLPFDMSVRRRWAGPYSPSIDRISAGGGYTKSNCRVILFAMNAALNDWSLEVFMPIAEALVRRYSKMEAA